LTSSAMELKEKKKGDARPANRRFRALLEKKGKGGKICFAVIALAILSAPYRKKGKAIDYLARKRDDGT